MPQDPYHFAVEHLEKGASIQVIEAVTRSGLNKQIKIINIGVCRTLPERVLSALLFNDRIQKVVVPAKKWWVSGGGKCKITTYQLKKQEKVSA